MNEIGQIVGSAVGITQTGEMIPLRVVGKDETEVPDTQGHKRVILWGHGGRLVTHTGKDAAKVLRENDAQIYRHNGKVAIIDPETKRIKIGAQAEFGSWCEEHGRIVFQQFTRNGLEDKSLTEPESKALLNNCKFIAGLRPLSRVLTAETPFLNDGKLELQAAGYNAETQSLTIPAVEYADKQMKLEDARAIFNCAFRDVAWPPNDEERKRGEAVLIASILTPYLACYFRRAVRRPGFLFTANEVGAGKTTLLYFALTTIFGAPIKTTPPPAKNDDANVSKLIDSVVQNGLSYFAIDNWDKKIDSGPLAHLITANAVTGRILGGSAMFDAAVQCDIYITATTKHFSSEMRRRLLDVDLYVQQARAEDRPIKKPLDEYEVEAVVLRSIMA
jgi:hypothetical protein